MSESESGLVNQPNSLTPESNANLAPEIGDEDAIRAEVASPSNMGIDEPLNNVGTDADLDTSLDTSAPPLETESNLDASAPPLETESNLDASAPPLETESSLDASAPPLETNSSNEKSITIEITKDKLDELLTKISEETINYLSLLIKFLEKKIQFDTNNEKLNKTIQELTKIKDDTIKLLTENEITSNGFDPSSSAQKSQYAEMIMAALGIAAAVTGGKKSKSKKREKKHKKTKNPENKHYNHKTKKHRRKKGKTKGHIVKINNDPNNKDNN